MRPRRSFAANRTAASILGRIACAAAFLGCVGTAATVIGETLARDPGPRGGASQVGHALSGLTRSEQALFAAGEETFREKQSVTGSLHVDGEETEAGLGPRFNLDTCANCHSHPAFGGSAPAVNPQVAAATRAGAANVVPYFVMPDGPVRVARFKLNPDGSRDGSVHQLFTIAGRSDAPGCRIVQPDFDAARRTGNVIFRIPTPVFGGGLIEAIDDSTIRANRRADAALKQRLGIAGHPNTDGHDQTITRFGWKAQNK